MIAERVLGWLVFGIGSALFLFALYAIPAILARNPMRAVKAIKYIFAGIGIAYVLFVIYAIPAMLEIGYEGPHTKRYNFKMRDLFIAHDLIGKDQTMVVKALGEPDLITHPRIFHPVSALSRPRVPRSEYRILNAGGPLYSYFPYPLLPFGKFEVSFEGCKVRGYEMFD